MMRRIPAFLALLLVGYPLLIASSAVVAALGTAALLVCVLGILAATPVLVVGIVLALAEYALALGIGNGPPRLAGAVFLGVVVMLLVETADFGRRTHGAALGPRVARAQMRALASTAALASTTALGVAAACGLASTAVRLPWAPAVAAAGGALALAGIALALAAARTTPRD